MKKILFILLVFTSFQGFSQIVQIKELGIEFIVIDKQMDWYLANIWIAGYNESFKNNPWRLPTSDELRKIYKTEYAGNFKKTVYWCSKVDALDFAETFSFWLGTYETYSKKNTFHFCLFRTLK